MNYTSIKFWIYIAAIFIAPHLVFAATDKHGVSPPRLPNMDYIKPTITSSPINNVSLGKLEVEFERTTLGEIQKYANEGVIYHRGDAGDSEDWICYTVSTSKQKQRIWFSSGELQGPEQTISGFYAVIDDDATEFTPFCPELSEKLRPALLGNGLWLGDNVDRLKNVVGKPSATIDDWKFYAYEGKVFIKDDAGNENLLDRLKTLGAKVQNGKIVALVEFQATTN